VSDEPPPQIKFPVKPTNKAPVLALPRRRRSGGSRSPYEVAAASLEARRKISEIFSATRAPFAHGGTVPPVPPDKFVQLEQSLRELEARLTERERHVSESEARIEDRERDLAEAEALIIARQKLLDASRASTKSKETGEPVEEQVSAEERAALEQLKAELDKQEESLKEQREAILEREKFLEENESKLFEKMMQQQEQETELEQRREDLASVERRLQDQGAIEAPPPEGPLDEMKD